MSKQDAPVIEESPDDIADILGGLESEAERDEATPTDPTVADEMEKAAAQSQQEYEAVLTMCIGMTFNIVAPNWEVSEAETQQLAGAYAGVLDKYFPGGMESFGVEVGAALVTAAIIAPRIGKPRIAPIVVSDEG